MEPAFVTAADLNLVHAQNRMLKFTDDTYLVVRRKNTGTCHDEIEQLQTLATAKNLRLNSGKKKEIVFLLGFLSASIVTAAATRY